MRCAAGTPDFRIFVISNGVTASISGLTIANGSVVSGSGFSMDSVSIEYEATGGGICNMGALVLSNSVVSGNTAYASAGGGFTVATVITVGPTYEAAGGNPGTLVNGPVRVAGRVGSGALQFDGINDHVNVPPGGLATTSPTLAISVESENDLVVLKWSAQAGRTYRVEYTDDLTGGDWTALPGTVTVSGNTARTEDTLGLSTQRFYRVVIEP